MTKFISALMVLAFALVACDGVPYEVDKSEVAGALTSEAPAFQGWPEWENVEWTIAPCGDLAIEWDMVMPATWFEMTDAKIHLYDPADPCVFVDEVARQPGSYTQIDSVTWHCTAGIQWRDYFGDTDTFGMRPFSQSYYMEPITQEQGFPMQFGACISVDGVECAPVP